ncbi:MAG: Pyruvate kinase II [Gammaproteobacteria bacterium]|nr:Pyruvate kinase II [Gammaproteobacteria bacterium]
MLRRTKIVATLGPACDRSGELEQAIVNGLDVARVNFSHGRREDHESRVRTLRELAERHGRHVAVLVDLQGPKIRIERFKDGPVTLSDGVEFILDPGLPPDAGDQHQVGVTYKNLAGDISPGDILLLDDGNLTMEVRAVHDGRIVCRVNNGGVLSDNKGLNRQGGGISAEALTDKDIQDIRFAVELDADFIAVSFVRDAEEVDRARALVKEAGGRGHIIAKIERAEAIDHVDEIIQASDGVMVARGDLGVEIGDAELVGMQKRIIQRSRGQNRVVITATQMMQSMVENPQPTRAEVMDVANAVIDGTDAVMLSGETAVGRHPAKVIDAMDRICRGAERQRVTMMSNHRPDAEFETIEEAIAMASMYVANHFDVKVIVAMTESGTTARLMSRISSGIPIVAMSRRTTTLRRVTLYRGVYPVYFESTGLSVGESEQHMIRELQRLNLVDKDDSVAVTMGDVTGVAGGTNTMKVVKV